MSHGFLWRDFTCPISPSVGMKVCDLPGIDYTEIIESVRWRVETGIVEVELAARNINMTPDDARKYEQELINEYEWQIENDKFYS